MQWAYTLGIRIMAVRGSAWANPTFLLDSGGGRGEDEEPGCFAVADLTKVFSSLSGRRIAWRTRHGCMQSNLVLWKSLLPAVFRMA
jgi:hypothetical protein